MKLKFLSTTALIAAFTTPAFAVEKSEVVANYANIAAAKYSDSLITAQTLQSAINALVANPSAEALQTEVVRQIWTAC